MDVDLPNSPAISIFHLLVLKVLQPSFLILSFQFSILLLIFQVNPFHLKQGLYSFRSNLVNVHKHFLAFVVNFGVLQ